MSFSLLATMNSPALPQWQAAVALLVAAALVVAAIAIWRLTAIARRLRALHEQMAANDRRLMRDLGLDRRDGPRGSVAAPPPDDRRSP